MFESVIGQVQVKQTLEMMLRAGTLPHALLFAGSNGVGKTELAIALAARLLCERGPLAPCGECSGCRRAMRLEHPDLYILFPFPRQPEEKSKRAVWVDELIAHRNRLRDEPYAPIVYDQAGMIVRGMVDEVREQLLQGSLEAGGKVCIILQAEK
jgi:DNA polymerase III delta prime subunit